MNLLSIEFFFLFALIPSLIFADYDNFHSGYISVNQSADSSLFYQLIPVNNTNLSVNAPLILWLQGGPYYIQNINGTLTPVPRNITWSTYFHMLYLDNPSTVGYSIPGSDNVTDTTVAAQQMLVFLENFFALYPILQSYKFYIFGESYAGKYIPSLAYEILTSASGSTIIPLAGIGIGNAWTDPINQMVYGEYSLAAGIVDFSSFNTIHQWELQAMQFMYKKQYMEANDIINTIESYIQSFNATGGVFINNYNQYFPNVPILEYYGLTEAWLNLDSTKQLYSVSLDHNFNLCSGEINNWWSNDIPQSVADKLAYVLNYLPVLLYNGADDIEVNTAGVLNFIGQLPWSGVPLFRKAQRQIWMTKEGVAGNVVIGGNLTFATVYKAGHIVPFDQPKSAIDMITRWTSGLKNWNQPGLF